MPRNRFGLPPGPHPALSRRERVPPPSPSGGRAGDEGLRRQLNEGKMSYATLLIGNTVSSVLGTVTNQYNSSRWLPILRECIQCATRTPYPKQSPLFNLLPAHPRYPILSSQTTYRRAAYRVHAASSLTRFDGHHSSVRRNCHDLLLKTPSTIQEQTGRIRPSFATWVRKPPFNSSTKYKHVYKAGKTNNYFLFTESFVDWLYPVFYSDGYWSGLLVQQGTKQPLANGGYPVHASGRSGRRAGIPSE